MEENKMKKIYGILAAVFVMAAGCAKEETQIPVGNDVKTVLVAGVDQTKTVLDGVEVYWTDNDRIVVSGVTSDALDLSEPAASASFTFDGKLNTPHKAVFPASIYVDETTVRLPSFQESHESSFAADASPMAAYATSGTSLTFSHLCAVVRLTVTAGEDSDEISYVEFSGKNGEQLSGDFRIDYETKTLVPAGTSSASGSVRVAVGRAATASEPVVVHIVVPAGEYSEGYTVKVADINGHYMEKSTGSGRILAKGVIVDAAPFAFAPDKTGLDVEIRSAADLVQFSKDWNGKMYTADAVVNLMNDIEFTAAENESYVSMAEFSAVFNGNGHKITGYENTAPVFTKITGEVHDLSIEGKVTKDLKEATSTVNFGGFACNLDGGLMSNCHSYVDVSVTGSTTGNTAVGGLVGYLGSVGIVENCASHGDVVIDSNTSTTQLFKVGQLVGRNWNVNSRIKDSYVDGTIYYAGASIGTGDASCMIGGLVGYLQCPLKNCEVRKNSSATDGTETATILVNAQNTSELYVGGVVGWNNSHSPSMAECTNNADVLVICNGNLSANTINIGGVLGAAGIGGVTAAGLVNNGDVTFKSSAYQYSDFTMGGVIGNVSAITIVENTRLVNNGNVTWNSSNGWTVDNGNGISISGVVGKTSASLASLENNGDVTMSEAADANTVPGDWLQLSGCVGKINAANLTLSDCQNSGVIKLDLTGNGKKYNRVTVGGVLGLSYNGMNVSISDCSHSGEVSGGRNTNDVSGWKYFGGIAGYVHTGTITDCDVTGKVACTDKNMSTDIGSAVSLGGIVGRAYNVNIIGCEVSSEDDLKYYLTCRGAFLGGIAGYARGGKIEDCSCRSSLKVIGEYCGGIVGTAYSVTMTNCHSTSAILPQSSLRLKSAGGLCGETTGTVSVISSSYKGSMKSTLNETVFGGIVGKVLLGTTTIGGCRFGGTFNDSAFALGNIVGSGTFTQGSDANTIF